MKTLIILAHPNLKNSLANKTIINELIESDLDIEIRNISELYPDFNINVNAEQEALVKADNIVFQFPFYWYNMPSILKQWFDAVFEYQFAYGSEGDKLKGKNFIPSFTVGGSIESYTFSGYNNFPVTDFTKNLEQTSNFAQMHYTKPIFENSMVYLEGIYNVKEEIIERARKQAKRVLKHLLYLQTKSKDKKGTVCT
ncbi:NAD(P)H-dependent oxidoreductase [Flavivirga abyssicola]|uniref:NAD(P)H-dependent oxidoreductase n=1 Tax=Flavivirga abyssicola TaxID=3063533 RepID=UPI0026DF9740|nr:NAD(P)H-dependent oxidoreductase [Flavivirga sp. MEBiC07777]WVK14372.1 NAD(P)H-dependent oxidoreductase [Flavivirga sp. MEBiC07777]